jgi:hypothetical protein
MYPRNTTFLALVAVGVVFSATWYFASRPAGLPAVPVAATADATASAAWPAAATPVSNPSPPRTGVPGTAKLIADSASGDAGKRAAAITALAEAPRADALPVLARLLTDGEPQVDRPLALRSLRDLALTQGDADGAIRDAVRHAIYHGDDQTRIDDVQEVLDTIEESQLR